MQIKSDTLIIIFLLTAYTAAAGRYFSRNRACNLLLPPDAIIFTAIVSKRPECLSLIAPIADACCTIYDSVTHNCTVVRTDRFRLVPNASASLEVGIDSVFSTKNLIYLLISFKSHSPNLSIRIRNE